jgi:xanthine dehydrogenase FAD-binding subunit
VVRAIKKYSAPQTLDEATRVLAAGGATPLAGGTDLLPRWSRGLVERPEAVIDLKRINGLKGVSRANGEIRVGACTPLSDIASDPTIRSAAPVLADAADRVACPQIRNRATIGGNLCNASPAADTAIPLILLDAVVELVSQGSDGTTRREVPIADFFRGPGATVRAPAEILTQIRFKPLADRAFAAWDKFGTRRAMEIAVASAGVALVFDGGTVVRARVGCGSVAPIPLRGRRAEAQLAGSSLSDEVIHRCTAVAQDEIAPITDVRASAAYRREVVGVLLRRMLERARGERKS